jgi:hypothetical protein
LILSSLLNEKTVALCDRFFVPASDFGRGLVPVIIHGLRTDASIVAVSPDKCPPCPNR